MKSDNTIHELLPWYATGTLEADQAEEFRRHLPGCDACRAEMAFVEKLQAELDEHGGAFLEDHPSPERLVAAASGESDAEEAASVRKHLSLCATCAEEVSWITGESSYAAAAPTYEPARGTSRFWTWAAGIAALFLIASIPIVLLSRGGPGEIGAMTARQVPATERSAGSLTRIELEAGQRGVTLIFDIDLRPDAFPFTFVIRNAGGREMYRLSDGARDSLVNGYLFVKNISPGSYTALAFEAGKTEPELWFRFEVVTP